MPKAVNKSKAAETTTTTIPIGDLKADPKNCRRHSERNVGAITTSLQKVGTGRSIVIDEDGVVLAGNATVKAASAAGIKKVKIIDADGDQIIAVRRRGLTAKQKAELAIADNRAGELATWDTDNLLATLNELDIDPADVTFSDEELTALAAASADGEPDDEGPGAGVDQNVADKYEVVISARDEAHQRELFTRLNAEGLKVRVLTV